MVRERPVSNPGKKETEAARSRDRDTERRMERQAKGGGSEIEQRSRVREGWGRQKF